MLVTDTNFAHAQPRSAVSLSGEVASTVAKIGAHLYDKPFMSHVDTRGTGGANGGYVLLPPSRTIANPQRHTHAGV